MKIKYGELSGIFKDNALQLVFKNVSTPNYEDLSKFIESSMDYVLANGVTSIHHLTEPLDRNRGGVAKDLAFYEKYNE